MTVAEDLRTDAIRHLWMQSGGWIDYAEAGGPIIVAEASGLTVMDTQGRRWLDVNGGYASVSVGYGRREIADAVLEQMAELAYYPEQTVSPAAVRLAEEIARLAPGDLERSWLVSGGSEANETAIKMARAFHSRQGESGRYKIISRRGSYHGATGGVAWLGRSEESMGLEELEPSPLGYVYVPQPNPYRCQFGGGTPDECAELCAAAVERAIVEEGPDSVAALIGEPITSSMGAIVPGQEYWPTMRDICDQYGVLLIADEVVCGFGRTGRTFGMDHFGVVPDLMTVAKGLGSSYVPVGSVVATPRVADAFVGQGRVFNAALTAGGHPVAAAAALANLAIIQRENLVERSAELGRYFLDSLAELASAHPVVGDIRGAGLLVGLELVADPATKSDLPERLKVGERMTEMLRRRGLLLRMLSPRVLQMAPPLCVTREELDEITHGVDSALTELEAELAAA